MNQQKPSTPKIVIATVVFAAFVVVVAAAAVYLTSRFNFPKVSSAGEVSARATALTSVIVARTDAERELGLGGRDSLSPETGMLFVFDHAEKYGFWMKDMKFAIDIVWLDENLRVVHVENSLLPETYPKIFSPGENSRFVLEVAAGIAQKNNYSDGQILDFLRPYIYTK